MHKNMNEILKYINDDSTPFYSHLSDYKANDFLLPKYDNSQWVKTNSLHWTYMMCKNHVLPDQGWKIHITCKMNESYNILFDVAKYLISKEISFKFVPNIIRLQSKNSKYGDRSASGKFITIYPKDIDQFTELLNDLYDITKIYQPGPYILNDQQWKNSNVFFRYGGIKEIKSVINGKETLVIKNNKGEYIEDLRVPYYHQYDFVQEPSILKKNIFPDEHIFEKLNSYNITDCIHYSNAGGVLS